MIVKFIYYDKEFEEEFLKLPKKIQKKAYKTEELFTKNPFHPSLRLHRLHGKLKGLWSISIDRKYRIIFEVIKNEGILFASIGLHAIYE